MQKRVIGLLIIFGLIILSLSFISAAGCDVRLRTLCQTDPWDNIVMGLSANTNAHGENATDGTYPYVLCCDFQGDRGGTGTNKIIGLSSITNAHAEIPSLSNYPVNVYYTSIKDCRDTTSNCALDEIGILSLSATTNAHLGTFDSYTTKICCKYAGSAILTCTLKDAYWSTNKDTLARITQGVDDSVMQGTQVKLVVEGDNCGNDIVSVSFDVREDDEGPATTNPQPVFFNSGKAVGTWTAEYVDDGLLQGDPEYYFIAAIIKQDKTINSKDKGNPLLTVTEQDPDWCATNSIYTCNNYPNELTCNSDSSLCDVAEASAPSGVNCNDPLVNCDCAWNSEAEGGTGACEFVSSSGAVCGNGVIDAGEHCDGIDWGPITGCSDFGLTGEGLLCVECKFSTINCIDGFGPCGNNDVDIGETCDGNEVGKRDWGQIVGCQDFNEFDNTGTLSCSNCQFNTSLCTGGSGWDINKPSGTCRYSISPDDNCDDGLLTYIATWIDQGEEKPSWCENRIIQCPTQIQLPFFNIYNIIGVVILIILIYLVLVLKKKKLMKGKRIRRVGSKKRKKRKK